MTKTFADLVQDAIFATHVFYTGKTIQGEKSILSFTDRLNQYDEAREALNEYMKRLEK